MSGRTDTWYTTFNNRLWTELQANREPRTAGEILSALGPAYRPEEDLNLVTARLKRWAKSGLVAEGKREVEIPRAPGRATTKKRTVPPPGAHENTQGLQRHGPDPGRHHAHPHSLSWGHSRPEGVCHLARTPAWSGA